MSNESYAPTERTSLRRIPVRGSYDRALVHAILDEALVCHLGFCGEGGQPFVIPTAFARDGERLFIHGAPASRMLKLGAGGAPLCATVTLLDGLVMARSAFHHSMNYRSVVVLGQAAELTDEREKLAALEAFVEKVSPGRPGLVRAPSAKELSATRVLALPLTEVSAKVRSGPPIDDEADLAVPVWAGVVRLVHEAGGLVPDGDISGSMPVPALPRWLVR
jgi:uncharacterized protein